MPLRLTRPTVGFKPTSAATEAGQRMLPSVSVPIPIAARLAAIAVPVPELDPQRAGGRSVADLDLVEVDPGLERFELLGDLLADRSAGRSGVGRADEVLQARPDLGLEEPLAPPGLQQHPDLGVDALGERGPAPVQVIHHDR